MKPEAQRIAIAKACGYKLHEWGITAPSGTDSPRFTLPVIALLPDYLNDRNATAEMLKHLPVGFRHTYIENLERVLGSEFWEIQNIDERMAMLEATPAQKREAFLKTMGLWKEES